MNAEVSAKGFEKCKLLTRLFGQKVENLDDYGCPKIQDLVGEGKTDSSWICSSYLFWHKTRLHCAERKAKVYVRLWRINCLGWNFVQCGSTHFTLMKIMNKLISTKHQVFISFVGPSETGKSQLIYNWLKIGTIQPKFHKIYFFWSTFPTSQRCYAKRIWKSRVCSGSKLWIYWLVKKQQYKVLVNIWSFLWRGLQFKSFCWYCHYSKTLEADHNLL